LNSLIYGAFIMRGIIDLFVVGRLAQFPILPFAIDMAISSHVVKNMGSDPV
jgi:hypothetical protein